MSSNSTSRRFFFACRVREYGAIYLTVRRGPPTETQMSDNRFVVVGLILLMWAFVHFLFLEDR